MKPVDGYNKLRGGYYTPEIISEFISQWAIRSAEGVVLEPSCGDGSFLSAITNRFLDLGLAQKDIKQHTTGVELDPVEAQKASKYGATIVCNDFFTYYAEAIDNHLEYDAIVGNPPFIRYQNFDENYRKIAFSLMNKHGFHPNRLTNIWLPFLLLSCKALKSDGRIGMVIPAELFQVDYAAEARLFLSSFFESLTLITFKQLVFDDIQQEVVLLLGEKKSIHKGIRVVELDGLQDLYSMGQACLEKAEIKQLDHSNDKWVKYYLTKEELELLKKMNEDARISNASDLFEVNVGLVSGENDFFVINQQVVTEYDLQKNVIPIVSRADQLKGLFFSDEDYLNMVSAGRKMFFFAPGNVSESELTSSALGYIQFGESKEYNKNYKCRTRPRWYHVSQSWLADAFLIRQANMYPRMIINQKQALVTDTLHKVRFCTGVSGEKVAAAFLNTYTFALAETIGRSYGGGVLTFEPGEMRRIRIPMIMSESLNTKKIDAWQRNGEIEKILDYTDEALLKNGLGLTEREINLLHSIWNKMRYRRLARKSQKRGNV